MIAWVMIVIAVGVALGIGFYCITKIKEIQKIKEVYESYIIDMIEELEEYRNNENNYGERKSTAR